MSRQCAGGGASQARRAWDVILGAEISHTLKPPPETYLRSAAEPGTQPTEVLLAAAHDENLAAASWLGLQTAPFRVRWNTAPTKPPTGAPNTLFPTWRPT